MHYKKLKLLPLYLLLLSNKLIADDNIVLPTLEVNTPITNDLFNVPASVDIISGEQIRNSKLQVNLSENLMGIPGVQIQNRNNYAQDLRLSIRGSGARSAFGVRGTRIYVDGIPSSMPDGQAQISNIDLSSVDHIEVLRGPFSSLYGNSSGGVIQIFTEDGSDRPTLEASSAAGSYNTYRNNLKATGSTTTDNGIFNYTLSGSHFSTTGYRDHSDTQKNLQNMKLSWQIDPSKKVTFVVNSIDLKAQDPLGVSRETLKHHPKRIDDNRAQLYDTRKKVTQTQGGLLYEQTINDNNELSAMFYYGVRDNTQYQAIPKAAQANKGHAGGVINFQRQYGGADVHWTSYLNLFDQPLTVVSGLSYDLMSDDRKGYENFILANNNIPIYGEKGNLRRKEKNTLYNLDPYMQASWHFLPKWHFDAGIRYSTVHFKSDDHYLANGDDSGSKTYHRALPVFALHYEVSPIMNLYTSYGKGFETPTFTELSYRPDGKAGLNLSLKPAVSDNYEMGMKLLVPNGLITADIFQINTKDEIVSAGSMGGRTTYQNGGKTKKTGFELGWQNTFAKHIHTQVSYTWLDAYYDETVSQTIKKDKKIPGIAKESFYASIEWKPETGWYIGTDAQYMSKIYVNDENSAAAPSYMNNGLYTGYTWASNDHWKINGFIRVDNVFNKNYAGSVIVNDRNGYYYEPAAKRNYLVGVTTDFKF